MMNRWRLSWTALFDRFKRRLLMDDSPELPLRRYPADTNPEELLTAFEEDGFVLVQNVLNSPEIEAAREKIDRLSPLVWDFIGSTEHYKNVFNRDPFWLPFIDRTPVIDIAELTLGENCHIIGETAWKSHPAHRGVGVHLDYLPFELDESQVPAGFKPPPFMTTAHFYLSEITSDLCPTYVIPGSHRAFRKPARGEMSWHGRIPQPVLCNAGDVLYFRSDLWHSGSDTEPEDQYRYLLQVHYGRREMAHHFAPYLDWRFNPEVIKQCTPRQLRLLGDHPQGAYD